MLVVDAPAGYEPERRWILDVVLRDRLGLDWRLEVSQRTDVRVRLDGGDGRCVVMPDVLFGVAPEHWLRPASLPRRPLARRDGLPVIFGSDPPRERLTGAEGDTVALDVDILGSCFFMLSRLEEHVVATRDSYGRFPASASLAHGEGFLRVPIVDRYVDVLWAALARLWPQLQRPAWPYRVTLTHDVDDPLASLGRTPTQLALQLGADAVARRDAALALRRMRSWVAGRRGDHRTDPYNTFDFLMDVAERHGIAATFNFMAADEPSRDDISYRLDDPWIAALIARIHRRGHEIGFHAVDLDPDRTVRGFQLLREAARRSGVEQSVWGGRTHYLRWQNPLTWSTWERAGLDYDATLAYADEIGFRTGTCHEYRPYDLLERRPLRLTERPFQVMDQTLFQYMRLADDAALAAAAGVASECRRHGGVFSLLWHNSFLPAAREKRTYERLVAAVTAA
jgi:uncharacterized protein DUF7033